MNIFIPISAVLLTFCLTISSDLLNSTNLAKPGCENRCGDLIVPYPFGVGDNSECYRDKGFHIYCNTSVTPPKASFTRNNYVYIINISDSTVRTSSMVGHKCSSPNGTDLGSYLDIYSDKMPSPYTLSKENKFTLIGCYHSAWMNTISASRIVYSGCLVFCVNPEDIVGEECTGTGCCQSTIPTDIRRYTTHIQSLEDSRDNETYDSSFNPCSYAFIGEKNMFKFNGVNDLNDSSFIERIEATVPVVLEWAIGNLSCSQAEATNGYACQSNTTCVSSKRKSGGYRCLCKEGYEGNPYLSPGCQDINECRDTETYRCNGTCINTEGSYDCMCPHGYSGNGKIPNGCKRTPRQTKFTTGIFILGVVIGSGILVLAIFVYKLIQKRNEKTRRQAFFRRNGGLLLQQQILNGEHANDQTTRLFSAKELEKATDHYHEDRIVGRGGQGTVYKGMLNNGNIVAVKRSMLVDENQVESFINEVFLLSQISHRNVVKLHGCCLETAVPILVYEFVANGDLSQFIHDENYEFPTFWSIRLRIATEVAGALGYMHSDISVPIFHRDIKSPNVLLDDRFRAKLSDFGISKSVMGDQSHISTLVRGTTGCVDPEYFESQHFTDKSDVYSFGVVLAELLTGKKPVYTTESRESRSLAALIRETDEEHLMQNIDNRLLDGPQAQLLAVFRLTKRCLSVNGNMRPTMREVAIELEAIRAIH